MDNCKKRVRKKTFWIVLGILCYFAITMYYHTHKALPEGLSFEGKVHHVEDINFIYDLPYLDHQGEFHHEGRIFDRVNQIIQEAEEFIVLDMFLFNHFYDGKYNMPKLSQNLTTALINKKKQNPETEIVLITDHINTTYGSHTTAEFEKLRQNGVQVIFSDLKPLRDSNFLYSSVWRTFFQWFQSEPGDQGWLPNPMSNTAPEVTLRSYLELLNIKANHRKVIVTDKTSLVTSGNPHNASGFHSNIAFEIKGNIKRDFLASEKAIAEYSKEDTLPTLPKKKKEKGDIQVQVLTEGKIYQRILEEVKSTKKGQEIWLGMFYLAERNIITELINASERGVKVRIILDPNQNAFGQQKMGLPNIPVAKELNEAGNKSLQIKWYNTKMEQYHTKLLYIKKREHSIILGGSANYTTRNLKDLNPETNVWIKTPKANELDQELSSYFHRIWKNKDADYTQEYSSQDYSIAWLQYIGYRIQKALNFTTY
ncbi:phospholipase D family protein [Rossellomorea sp. BNER]|uniref:phospholipase D family protein n=1 Tax=Rossellomorea sp. BNER TaxID=2962031 RepID=UPI003AF2B092|nr:phospholipase D family protein [Rossellomorea sp. BNER]